MADDWATRLGAEFLEQAQSATTRKPPAAGAARAREAFYGILYPDFVEALDAAVERRVKEYNEAAECEALRFSGFQDQIEDDSDIFNTTVVLGVARTFPPKGLLTLVLSKANHMLTLKANGGTFESEEMFKIDLQDGHIVLADPTHSGLIDIDKRLENAFINAFRLF